MQSIYVFAVLAGGDIEADDGIYSAYFLDLVASSSSARYGLSVKVEGSIQSQISINDVLGMVTYFKSTCTYIYLFVLAIAVRDSLLKYHTTQR